MSRRPSPLGIVFDIQRAALHDGPGVRTTVFLNGCPLRCPWCHNPESRTRSPQLGFDADKCSSCRTCADACLEGVHAFDSVLGAFGQADSGMRSEVGTGGPPVREPRMTPMFARTPGPGVPTRFQSNAPCTFDSAALHLVSWDRCTLAGNCVSSCPSDALRIYGSERAVPEIMEIVRRDKAYYARSGGGLTLSGGEPTSQIDFAEALLRAAKAEGIHTCVETCGFAPRASFERLLDCCDLFLFDIKASDEEKHRELTGVPFGQIRDNLRWLAGRGAKLLLRCPMIPGVNDDQGHLRAIAALSRELPLEGVELLPYHESGLAKRERIGSRDPFVRPPVPDPGQIAAWRAFLVAEGCRGLL